MRRGFTTFLLMLCLCWQALGHAGVAVLIADQGERQHALMHLEGREHHHHDDADAYGDVHEDRSLASAQHLASDCGVHAPVLMSRVDLRLPSLPPQAPGQTAAAPPPPPCLAGLDRPPKSLS